MKNLKNDSRAHLDFLAMMLINFNEKFDETTLPEKHNFCSNLSMKDITNLDLNHDKRVCKDLAIKAFGECHDLYLTLPLAEVFENLIKMCLEICQLDPARFLSVPLLARLAALKTTKVELQLLTDIDLLLLVKKAIRGGICHS